MQSACRTGGGKEGRKGSLGKRQVEAGGGRESENFISLPTGRSVGWCRP